MSLDNWRQSGIVSHDTLNSSPLTVIGCGGIGSPSIFALAKMGCEDITVYDPDILETHNLMTQFYRLSDVDSPKVVALQDIIKNFTGTTIKINQEKFVDQDVKGIVISGVDSMEARKQIWEKMKYNPLVDRYIEARMGAEVGVVYTVDHCDPDAVKKYETTLYTDEEADEAPCTERAIIYNVFNIASYIAGQVKKFLNGDDIKYEVITDLSTPMVITP